MRRGMGIRDVAYLGRWKSSVVLTYAEEALETTPANKVRVPERMPTQTTAHSNGPAAKTPKKVRAQAEEPACPLIRIKENTLWVKPTERGGNGPLRKTQTGASQCASGPRGLCYEPCNFGPKV